jgi:hypothetical protein
MTYRVGRKKKLVILDNNSLDVAHFRPGFESLAQTVCDLLNKQTDVNPHVMQQSEQLFCECRPNVDMYQEAKIYHTGCNKEVRVIRTK